MKILGFVIDTFLHFTKNINLEKWSVNGKPDSTVIGPMFRG
jgi:hypothetical protein